MSGSSPSPTDDRRAVPLAGGVLTPQGADLVLAGWRDPGGGTDPPRSSLIDAIHALEHRSPTAMEAAFAAHGSALVGWP